MVRGSKERIQAASSELLARRGYNGMGLKALSQSAGLPYGSIYHHFPGGKEEIAAAAISATGEVVGELLASLFASTPPADAVRSLFEFMERRLAASDWTDGCPVGTPAQDGAADSGAVREACDAALDRMVGAIADGLAVAGVEADTAERLATTLVAAYEGAAMLARVQRSGTPLRVAGDVMADLVAAAV